ncbi:tRNA guanosine(34) transglycosylase Tgt [Leptospira ognonensis]|uniref:Queuine tRNA-ribosyltransferase n=1 Tax=Leptospira ognonensis TaxID=2484945 RepID=A0A4R9JZG3_9LEPT|nr:tRNA guanosine(34) transglycosylase Tgt [Leptospira ognonensis]TGL58124.1 tRNA guanosine(34) transglycosylase Tgt [Leptospira ognonensis]
MSRLNFKLEKVASHSHARASTFTTLHGDVQTPIFMPVGTQATVRTLNVDTLETVGSNVLLANTYHLLLRPGAEVFRKLGGIHKFMNWDRPVLTDSGGFQIFSLPNARKMTEDGAIFRSYVDGENILLSPEISIEMQKAIGSDIMMVLDECVPSTVDFSRAKSAMEITHRWAKRSLKARGESSQSMFGIVQGACFPELRKESAKALTDMPFDGYAIGGLAVGETKAERNDFCELSASLLPQNLPRYLMGVGTPLDLLEAVHRGVDMFDCTIPVELAQRGVAFTSEGKFQIHRSIYKFLDEALDQKCDCRCCKHYSKAYLHHLIKAGEILGWQLIAEHNLTYYHKLMNDMRLSILDDTFFRFYSEKKTELLKSDNVNPPFTLKSAKKDRRRSLGDYEVVESKTGNYYSIRQKSSGEVMHSVNSPIEEADTLYIKQSHLGMLLEKSDTIPLVVWDVGLGAATNAMAAISAHERSSSSRKLTLISFENDLTPLKLALRNHGRFPHLFHKAPMALLKNGHWISDEKGIEWKLMEGDFQKVYKNAEAPDLIYFDPFSYETDSELWSYDFFCDFYSHLKEFQNQISLYTYSASTRVRSAMLGAGFLVARGAGSGPKSETTIAFTKENFSEEIQKQLLDRRWLERWMRSDAKYPENLLMDREKWTSLILSHPQFQPSILLDNL